MSSHPCKGHNGMGVRYMYIAYIYINLMHVKGDYVLRTGPFDHTGRAPAGKAEGMDVPHMYTTTPLVYIYI